MRKLGLVWYVVLTIAFAPVTTGCCWHSDDEDGDKSDTSATMPTRNFDCKVDREKSNLTEVTVRNVTNANDTICRLVIFNMKADLDDEWEAIRLCNHAGAKICPNCSSGIKHFGDNNISCMPLGQDTYMSYTTVSTIKLKRKSSIGKKDVIAIALSVLAAITITVIVIALSVKRYRATARRIEISANADITSGETVLRFQTEETGDPYVFATDTPTPNTNHSLLPGGSSNSTADVDDQYAVVGLSNGDAYSVLNTTRENGNDKDNSSSIYNSLVRT